MGLDVCLYTAAQHAANEAHDEASNAFYERPDYDQLTGEQKDEISATIPPCAHQVDVPSERFPEHYFNRRYLRSSYNGGGFNRAVPDFIGDPDRGSFYWIFEPLGRKWDFGDGESDPGVLTAYDLWKLEQCKARALEIAGELATCDPLRVESVHGPFLGQADHMWSQLPDAAVVLAWYREERVRHDAAVVEWEAKGKKTAEPFGGYSSAKGTVYGFTAGLDVLAITVGRDVLGHPAPMIVFRSTELNSYIESTEIIAEFCDEAMSLIEQDGSAYVSWSG